MVVARCLRVAPSHNFFDCSACIISTIFAAVTLITDPEARRCVVLIIVSLLAADNDAAQDVSTAIILSNATSTASILATSECRKGVSGRKWARQRNSPTWFFHYALQADFIASASWRSLFRISYPLFQRVANELRPSIEKSNSKFRKALPSEVEVAAFLLYSGGCTCEQVAGLLGIGPSTVSKSVDVVSRAVAREYGNTVRFPTEEADVSRIMKGFQDLSGLPYCVGAIDGTHIKWPACPEEQFYEYRCYKGFPSVVIFAVVTANRKFTYVDIGKPGVLGDATIFDRSTLKKNIEDGKWLGSNIPDLMIANVSVRFFLVGDFAFQLNQNMMKSCSEREKNANPVLRTWDKVASKTRKPVQSAFGMLKHRFPALKNGLKLHHENDIVLLIYALVILHNCSIDDHDDVDAYLAADQDEDVNVVFTAETQAGKRQRDALLYYVTNDFPANE